jgi:DNA polymerase-3 subunit delta'
MIVGHENNLKHLIDVVSSNNFSHFYLFVGPEHIGKTYIARYFAQRLLCEAKEGQEPCYECINCRLIESNNQPDLMINDGKELISVEEIRDLIHFLELKPYQSKMKIAVITHAERMTPQASNAFLKTLEEPTPDTLIVLTAENLKNILPTIISRAQILHFGFLKKEKIKTFLNEELNVEVAKAEKLADFSAGKPGVAISLANDQEKIEDIKKFVEEFLRVTGRGAVNGRLQLAEKIAQDGENVLEKLDYLENYFQSRLTVLSNDDGNLLKIVRVLDKIAKSRHYLRHNVNSRLMMETILLTGA